MRVRIDFSAEPFPFEGIALGREVVAAFDDVYSEMPKKVASFRSFAEELAAYPTEVSVEYSGRPDLWCVARRNGSEGAFLLVNASRCYERITLEVEGLTMASLRMTDRFRTGVPLPFLLAGLPPLSAALVQAV